MPNLYNPQIFNFDQILLDNSTEHYNEIETLVDCPLEIFSLKKYEDKIGNSIYFKVYDEDSNIACLLVIEPYYFGQDISYHQVKALFTNIYLRRMGLAIFLFNVLLEQGYKIISDASHTIPGSMNIWKRFYEYFPDNETYILNMKTGTRELYFSQFDIDVWGIDADDDFFLLDNQTKAYTIDEQFDGGTFSKDQRDYFLGNISHLKDLGHIRLMLE